MIFVEARAFSQRRADHLSDSEFRALQTALLIDPERGVVIPGTGGLRKLRWSGSGRGQRGGLRVIYYLLESGDLVLLLLLYPKNQQDDLTPEQKRILRDLVAAEIRARAEEL
jgi:mRNA-degrading endonuclease RelE of RelBE toxin-antitoxin system